MKILALELSSGQGGIAWLEDGRDPFLRVFANDRQHSGLFFETLQDSLAEFGAPSAIVVGLGPGSYAGVRIAIAAAVGLRAATKARLIGMASIRALEVGDRKYCVVGDARRQSFFFARVDHGTVLEGPSLHTAAEVERKMSEAGLRVYTSAPLPQFPQAILAFPSAERLGVLVRNQIKQMPDSEFLEPIYLREPHITTPKGDRMLAPTK